MEICLPVLLWIIRQRVRPFVVKFMPDTTLSLGPVVLRRFEVPDRINIGGKQRLAVHRLTDGTRVIDSLGRDDADISFSGILTGSDATMRARLLDVLRVAGDPLALTWDVFFYTVILSTFHATYENRTWIPYRITCTVLRDEAAGLTTSPVSLINSLLSDISAAALGCNDVSLDYTTLQATLAQPGVMTRDTAQYAAAQSGLAVMQSTVDERILAEEASLQASASSPATSALGVLTDFANASLAAQQVAILTRSRAYLGRAAVNLNWAST